MGMSRVADAGAPRVGSGVVPKRGLATRASALVASPLGVLVIVPTLVASVSAFLSVSNERALRKSNLAAAESRLGAQARLVAAGVREAVEQAEPILDRLAAATRVHGPDADFAPFAHTLADLMTGRPGVAYVSASFPDGTFQGAYLDDDGVVRFQDSRVRPDGTLVRRYDLGEDVALLPRRQERTTYDPRTRDFYTAAVRRGGRVFTDPYPFFMTYHTGITRAEPVYRVEGGARVLHAVITVDFDVHAMSDLLEARELVGTRALLYARDGTVLAYSHAGADLRASSPDRVLRFTDLRDPLLAAFFARRAARGSTARIDAGGDGYLVGVADASDASLGWKVAFMMPEAIVLAPLRAQLRRSAAVGSIGGFVAVIIAIIFARHITRTREEAESARAAAQEAQKVARELGSYRLVSRLGKGGMGEVWRAEHRLLSRAAAIKLVNPDVPAERLDELHTRFRREAQALASLRSRNTIEIYDYGVTDDGTFFYVMELLDGLDLETLVYEHGPQPTERVLVILDQMLASLAEAHDAGLVHRDIKPANVFVCRAADELDIVKVLDFGLVRGAAGEEEGPIVLPEVVESETLMSAHITRVGGLLGTPAFMPREQALGQDVDARADLYAVGGVAFFLLTGRLLFDHSNPMSIVFMHVQAPLPNLRDELPLHVPDALVEILTRCLAKDRDARPASARALAAELRAVRCEDEDGRFSEEEARAFWARRATLSTLGERVDVASAPTLVSLR